MKQISPMTQQEFIDGPLEVVRSLAPKSMAYAPGGTRRAAVLDGVEPWSHAYFQWARQHTIASFDLIFRHGVQHLFTPMLTSGNLRESNKHRDHILTLGSWLIAGPESMADYHRLGWRVRLLGAEALDDLQEPAAQLKSATAQLDQLDRNDSVPTLWWTASPNPDAHWDSMLAAAARQPGCSRREMIRAIFGEDIPLISLYLGFGKPLLSPELLPPILMGDMQCYWTQQVGYALSGKQLRMIFYDNAFLRNTWQQDKLERAQTVLQFPHEWQQGPIIGLGRRLGPFWYPQDSATPDPEDSDPTK